MYIMRQSEKRRESARAHTHREVTKKRDKNKTVVDVLDLAFEKKAAKQTRARLQMTINEIKKITSPIIRRTKMKEAKKTATNNTQIRVAYALENPKSQGEER